METTTEGHGGETEKRRQTELKARGSQKKIKENDSRQDMRAVASMVERQTVRINDLAFVRLFFVSADHFRLDNTRSKKTGAQGRSVFWKQETVSLTTRQHSACTE